MKEEEKTMRSECFKCIHRKEVPGNAHIRCDKPDSKMTGDSWGIQNGWFFYPMLFDPTWKTKKCSNHEVVSDAISEEKRITS